MSLLGGIARMSGLRDMVIGTGLALVVVASPWLYEHLAYRTAVQRLQAAQQQRIDRVESLKKARDATPQRDLLAKRLAAMHVNSSLPATLRQLGELSARARLTPSAVLVLPPVRVDVEQGEDGPSPWLEEFPVQITVPGSLDGLLRYVEALTQAPLPLRVDWIRIHDRHQDPTRGVVLQLGIRVLAEAGKN